MKLQLCVCLSMLLCLGACAGGRKKVTQGITYTRPSGQGIYYEFTAPEPLIDPHPTLADVSLPQEEAQLGEDEDFTSEEITSSYASYGDVVATAATRKFKLGDHATRKEMTLFMKAVDQAYAKVLRSYRPSGFTYSVSSVGAVNPLSQIEIFCRMSEHAANEVGQPACALFFNEIRTNYIQFVQEASN